MPKFHFLITVAAAAETVSQIAWPN